MPSNDLHPTRHISTLEEFRDWIRQEIRQCIGPDSSDLALSQSIHALGMSSVHVVRLAGEIEEHLAIEIDPIAFYDFESIETLCQTLWGLHERRSRRTREQAIAPASSNRHELQCRTPLLARYATPRTDWEQRLCTIWRDALKIEPIGIHDNFYALGGDATAADEICDRLEDLGVPASVARVSETACTVAQMGHAIELAGGKNRASPADWHLDDDAQLCDDIALPGTDLSYQTQPPRRILLTGATGYLGAFLLHEWIQQTQAHVVCLVRAPSVQIGMERLLTAFRTYDLDTTQLRDRVTVIPGDLTAPWLGLEAEIFRQLARQIDAIVHCAATVNFLSTYERLKASNVDATQTLLRLACADAPRAIPFHYISTLGVAMSASYDRQTALMETEPLRHGEDLLNGYEQSKYVGDRMVWTAFQERHIPAAIYRAPLVSGPSDGRYHKLTEFLPQALKGCLQMGAFPTLDCSLDLAPIDFVSKAVVHIARHPAYLNKAYYMTHPDSQPISAFIAWYQRAGCPIRGLPWDLWKQEFLAMGSSRLRHNALASFVELLRPLSQEQAQFPRVDSRQFQAAIRDLAFQPPPVLELLARYTRHFIETGFYSDVPDAWESALCDSLPTARPRLSPQI